MNQKTIYIIILFFASASLKTLANDSLNVQINTFINNFYSKPDYVENKTYLKIMSGFANINYANLNDIENFSQTYNLEFRYGFIRYDSTYRDYGVFTHFRDYASIETFSSDLKILDYPDRQLYSNSWHWSIGLDNGIGFISDKKILSSILFRHNSSIGLTNIDFNNINYNENSLILKEYNKRTKFTTNWTIGLDYHLTDNIIISFDSGIYNIYSNFDVSKWVGMIFFDAVIQRTPDFFEPQMAPLLEKKWFISKFIYKNFASFVLYKLRENEGFYPFNSEEVLTYNCYKIGFSFAL